MGAKTPDVAVRRAGPMLAFAQERFYSFRAALVAMASIKFGRLVGFEGLRNGFRPWVSRRDLPPSCRKANGPFGQPSSASRCSLTGQMFEVVAAAGLRMGLTPV